MGKDIVECVHWDPEVDPVMQASRSKNKWILLAGGLAVVAVAVGVTLWAVLPKREPVSMEPTTDAQQGSLPVSQTDPLQETQQQPTNEDPALAQGRTMYQNGDFMGAVANLDVVLANNPESGEAYTYRGLSYFSLGNYQNAVDDITKALPRGVGMRADIITMRGIAYYQLARYPEAIGDLTRAIELDPNSTNAYTYRAMAYDATGRSDLAMADRARIGQ